jgi:hypothetical protein
MFFRLIVTVALEGVDEQWRRKSEGMAVLARETAIFMLHSPYQPIIETTMTNYMSLSMISRTIPIMFIARNINITSARQKYITYSNFFFGFLFGFHGGLFWGLFFKYTTQHDIYYICLIKMRLVISM